jgi:uncharacterized protein (DUF302 family)
MTQSGHSALWYCLWWPVRPILGATMKTRYAVALAVLGGALLFPVANAAFGTDAGLITKQSRYSVRETIERFEAAVKMKESNGFMVFTELDHAVAAKKFGQDMLPRTVIVFGNPKFGTPVMKKTPLLAIDVPPKALVWQDEDGKVWLTYNSAEYLGSTIYPRHGLTDPASTPALAKALAEFSDYATK